MGKFSLIAMHPQKGDYLFVNISNQNDCYPIILQPLQQQPPKPYLHIAPTLLAPHGPKT